MSVRRRLQRLEDQSERAAADPPEERERRQRIFGELMELFEYHRAQAAGEDPGPPPQRRSTVEDERRVISDVIPHYRQSEGWQTEEGREFLDEWERRSRSRLTELDRS